MFSKGGVGRFSGKAFPGSGVDVADDQVHISLGQEFKTCPFGKDHAEHGMGLFHAAFLSAAHRITVINAGAFYPIDARFQCARIAEFRAPVRQQDAEKGQEAISAQLLFQTVKDQSDSPFCTAVHKKGEKEFLTFEEKSQKDFLESLEEWTVSISVQ